MKTILAILFAAMTSVMASNPLGCIAIQPEPTKSVPGVIRMWGENGSFWANGTVLNVVWIGGTRRQHEAAWKRFEVLNSMVGVKFVNQPGKPSQVRVAFDRNKGHWSYVGKGVLNIRSGPTMNLALMAGIFGDGDQEWDRVALHEICHTLGMQHEHQSPANGGVRWNIPYVLASYRASQGWSDQQIYFQVINRYSGTKFNGTRLDPDSIMMYPIDASMTMDGFHVGWNNNFSPLDRQFLSQKYPISLKAGAVNLSILTGR